MVVCSCSNQWTQDDGFNNAFIDPSVAKWDADLEEIFQKQASDVWCQPTPDLDSKLDFNFGHDDMLNFNIATSQMTNSLQAPQLVGANLQNVQPTTLTMSDFMSSSQPQHLQQQPVPAYFGPQQAFPHVQLPQNSTLQYPGPPVYKPINSKTCKIEPPIDPNSLIHYSEMSKYIPSIHHLCEQRLTFV